MAARPSTVAAVAFLVIGAALLANPLYVQEEEIEGSLLLSAEKISLARGISMTEPSVRDIEDLQPVARYAVRNALDNGTYSINRSAPPLIGQLFDSKWRYLGSVNQNKIYRTNVQFGPQRTTITLQATSPAAVEQTLSLSPPGELDTESNPKEIAWVADTAPAVVLTDDFEEPWEAPLETAVRTGSLTLQNRNNASTVAPLGSEVSYLVARSSVVHVTVTQTARVVTIQVSPVQNETLLSQFGVTPIRTGTLPGEARQAVVDAIESDGSVRTRRETLAGTRLASDGRELVRHEGDYYVLRRGHVDDFSLYPLIRMGLSGAGILSVLLGLGLVWWTRGED
ncbi:MAG: hypothetical protein ABEJ58_01810 [Halodesulfurarchaeum sp.]